MSQQDVLHSIGHLISSGVVVVHEDETPWFDLLRQMFPVRSSGICWEQLAHNHALYSEGQNLSTADKNIRIANHLHAFVEAAGIIGSETCVVIGDNTFSSAMEMPSSILFQLIPILFDEPQSTYVLSKDGKWCFAVMFENDMYFASSPRLAHGQDYGPNNTTPLD